MLNENQHKIMKLVIRGYSNSEIAKIMGIDENDVKEILKCIYTSLGVSNRIQASIKYLKTEKDKYMK